MVEHTETSAPKTICVVDMREPVFKSWARDIVSFGSLAATVWFANTQMPPSGWVNFTVCTIWLLWMVSKVRRHITHMTADQARVWLDKNYPAARAAKGEAE